MAVLVSLMEHYQLTEQDLDKQISDIHLDKISQSCCRKWKRLPPYLEMESIVGLDANLSAGEEEEKRLSFLFKWRDKKGFKASYKRLICALIEIESLNDAGRVCELVQISRQSSPGYRLEPDISESDLVGPAPKRSAHPLPVTVSEDEVWHKDIEMQLLQKEMRDRIESLEKMAQQQEETIQDAVEKLRHKEIELKQSQKELGDGIREKLADIEALKIKNQEVAHLTQELHSFHHKVVSLKASSLPITEDDFYVMDMQPHGVCLIINNYDFYHPGVISLSLPPRDGSMIDQYNLTQTFKYLRYDVVIHENLTAQQMRDVMCDMACQDHTHHDSFVCVISTLGEENVVYGADSQKVHPGNLALALNVCPSLRGKPKMFFVQACRGDGEYKGLDVTLNRKRGADSRTVAASVKRRGEVEWNKWVQGVGWEVGVEGQIGARAEGKGLDEVNSEVQCIGPKVCETIPRGADYFYGYATHLGNAAYRSKRHGSWYISELCKVFAQHAYTHSLSFMMKKVNNQVCKAYTKEGFKQSPEFVDRLRKDVHFFHFIKGGL
jgi:hypothetical protein